MAVLQTGLAKSLAEDYTIDQSLRFNDDDSPYLSRTFSAGNRKTFTLSFWIKRCELGSAQNILVTGASGSDPRAVFGFLDSDEFRVAFNPSGSSWVSSVETAPLYRDPGAWYHIVVAVDTTQAIDTNRVKLYVNGESPALSYATYPDQNEDLSINSAIEHRLGANTYGTISSVDGYLAEVYFIDGTAYDADDFGETDDTTNQWKPIDASDLTFGTNGFYQKYAATELANSFTDSAVKTVTAVGNAHTDTAVKKFGTASLQLDGTGDYLTVSDSSQWDFGTENWTIEFWVRFTGGSGSEQRLVNFAGDTSPPLGGMIETGTDDKMAYYDYELNSDWTKWCYDSTAYSLDTWYHYAIQRNGSTFKMFRDGVEQESDGTSSTSITSPQTLSIGTNRSAGGFTTGYIDEFRVSNVARYDGDFTVATEEFSPDINTLLLLHMDGANDGTTFTDSAAPLGRHTITANGDVTQTRAVKKVGDSSIVFDGTGDCLSIAASSDFEFSSSDPFTLEGWVRFTNLGAVRYIFYFADDFRLSWDSNYSYWYCQAGSNDGTWSNTPSTDTWIHVAIVGDGTNVKTYIAGTERISFAQAGTVGWTSDPALIGAATTSHIYALDGYMDEIRVSDTARYTSAFTPSATEFTADSNTLLLIHSNWNGGLGADSSGNNNTFTATNLVATDQMKDSPTNSFSTINPLINPYGTNTFAEGNLKVTSDSNWNVMLGTMPMSSGKWYWEALTTSTNFKVGVWPDDGEQTSLNEHETYGILYLSDGQKQIDGTASSYGASWTGGDIIGYAVDMDASTITFYKNNSSQGSISFSGTVSSAASAIPGGVSYSDTAYFNFGSDSSFSGQKTAQGNADSGGVGDFFYEPPSGYLALCTDNLSDPEIKLPGDNFNTVLWSGDDTDPHAITGVGFQPDFLWIKSRSAAKWHQQLDVIRGVTKQLNSNETQAETTNSDKVKSFDTDGFTLGTRDEVNGSGETYVAWNWLGANGTATNEDGDITSTVSANTTAGFSIATYTGNNTDQATIGHGLSQIPYLTIIKDRDNSSTQWVINPYGAKLANYYGYFTTGSITADTSNVFFYDSTASVVKLSNHAEVNASSTDYVMYNFHSVEGYSKIGSYIGNGSTDGTFIYTGFRPAYTMTKNLASAEGYTGWTIQDVKRAPYNIVTLGTMLSADTDYVEGTRSQGSASTIDYYDILSNGFKMKNSSYETNQDGATYLYIAFAEYPFKYAPAR